MPPRSVHSGKPAAAEKGDSVGEPTTFEGDSKPKKVDDLVPALF